MCFMVQRTKALVSKLIAYLFKWDVAMRQQNTQKLKEDYRRLLWNYCAYWYMAP